MLSKEEIRIVSAIVICSTILLASSIYFYFSPSQKTGFFQLSVTSPDGTILPPKLNVTSGQINALLITVQNSMGKTQICRLDTELLILNSSGNSLNSIAVNNYTLILNDTNAWSKAFTYKINNISVNGSSDKVIIFDNSTIQVSANQYNQNLLFQFKFSLWAHGTSSSNFSFTNTWVSTPFLSATT